MCTAGFCSFIYELALAQLLTGLLGGAMLRFATTLGVYIVALGIGSLSFKSRDENSNKKSFLFAEVSLFLLGLASPVLFVAFQRCSQTLFAEPSLQVNFVLATTHTLIFAMGFFCGRELPILSSIVTEKHSRADAYVLAADYGGMFLASLAFPFLMFPILGLISTFAFATLLNLAAAIATACFIHRRPPVLVMVLIGFVVMNISALIYSSELQTWLSRAYASAS